MKKNNKSGLSKTGSGPFLQLTGRQTAGWIGAVCFAMIWIFLVGVLVGRGSAPVEFDIDALQNELAELRQRVLQKEQVAIYDQVEKLSREGEVLDFYDTLKKNKVNYKLNVKKENKYTRADIPAGLEEDHVIPVKTRASGLKSKQAVTTVQKRPEPKPVAASKPASKPAARPAPPDNTAGKHTIQVASLKDPKDADALVSKLKHQGFPAYRVVGKLSETNIWYRVRVGAFGSEAESRAMMNKLRKLYKGAMLVSR